MGRGGPVCPPVSPCKGASVVQFPAYNACVFGMETSLRGRSGGHIGTAPTVLFGWIARGTVDVVWVDCVWNGWRRWGGLRINGYFVCMGLCGKI